MKRITLLTAALLLCSGLCACRPLLVILSPRDNARFDADAEVVFVCIAVDIPHGVLRDSAIVWRSDRDGILGTGARLRRAGLAPGRHIITAEATDPHNWHTAASCAIVVAGAEVPDSATTTTTAVPPPPAATTSVMSTTTSTSAIDTAGTTTIPADPVTTTSSVSPSPPVPTTSTTVSAWTMEYFAADVRIAVVWGASAETLYAGGGDTRTNRALVFRYDGTGWSEVLSAPDGGLFCGIWGSSAGDIFAVGGYTEGMLQKGIIHHYDGTVWHEEYTTSAAMLFSVWGDGAGGTVYAAGATAAGPLVLQRSGTRWQVRWSAVLPGAFFDLHGVEGDLCAAAGMYTLSADPDEQPLLSGKIFCSRDSAVTWTVVHEDPGIFLRALWGTGETVCAAGGDPAERSRGKAVCSSDAGTTWSPAELDAAQYCLNDISGTAGDNIYIAADGADGALLHYDGSAWSVIRPESAPLPPLAAVWCVDERHIVAAGNNVIVHYRP